MNTPLPLPSTRWIAALRQLRTLLHTGLLSLALLLVGSLSMLPGEVEAKRLGGKRSVGMQRDASPNPPPATPPKQADASPGAAAPAAGTAAAAAAGKRSWMGPLAGLAAGLGIAALLSHFGLGEGFADLMMMVLLAVALFFVVRLVMRRFAGAAPRLQAAGAGAGLSPVSTPRQAQPQAETGGIQVREAFQAVGGSAAAAPAALPVDFDAEGFVRLAKMIFIRLQAANDAGQVEDLRRFTTPELFAALRLDLHERGTASQQTDVVQLDAEILEVAQDAGQRVVSVRFHGLIREEAEHGAERFDEIWHLVRPADESRDWAIAGIQQRG